MSTNLRDSDGQLYPTIVGAEGTVHVLSVSSVSIQTGAFADGTTLVRVATAANQSASHCHYALGTNPTANTTACSMVPAGKFLYIAVQPGQKLAFIRGTNQDIQLSVTEILN